MCQNALYCREKEKNKQREDNWCKVQNLAMGNPQVSIQNEAQHLEAKKYGNDIFFIFLGLDLELQLKFGQK